MNINNKRTAEEDAITIVNAYYNAFNRCGWEAMCALCDENVVHDINQGMREIGKVRFREFLAHMARCYREELHDVIVMASHDGTYAAAEFQVVGTYLATDKGLPTAHGQKYDLPVGAFFALAKGKITRITTYYNLTDWLHQIDRSNEVIANHPA